MRSFFIYLLALHCVFNACALDQVVPKKHPFEEGETVSWFFKEEQERSMLGKGVSTPSSMSEHSIDSATGDDQFVSVRGENCDVVQCKNEENGKLVVISSLPEWAENLCVAFGFVVPED